MSRIRACLEKWVVAASQANTNMGRDRSFGKYGWWPHIRKIWVVVAKQANMGRGRPSGQHGS